MSALVASDIRVTRGGRAILDGVSAAFAAPGLTAVIGPNGAGKSTLLRALAGLIKTDAGVVTLDGVDVLAIERRSLAQRRAYLPQNARCEWPISVARVVALGLTPTLSTFGTLAPAHQARVDEMLALCDLSEKRDQAADTLSGGELARTMLARAMVSDPDILIADEPIAGLDPRHALDAMRRLKALGQSGKQVIVALHDLPLALGHADRVIALQGGRCVADGAAETVVTGALLRALYGIDARVERDEAGLAIRFL